MLISRAWCPAMLSAVLCRLMLPGIVWQWGRSATVAWAASLVPAALYIYLVLQILLLLVGPCRGRWARVILEVRTSILWIWRQAINSAARFRSTPPGLY